MHVKGCFQRGYMCVNEWLSGGRVLLHFQRRRAETVGKQNFYSQYDSRYVGCHWLQFAPFLCTNLIGQGPELLTTPAAINICGIAECAKLNVSRLTALEPVEVRILAH